MLNETSIKCFLSVAKHQNFTKASKELFMSRQAVNKQVITMEEKLGVKLFVRNQTLVDLTPEGQQYLIFFKNVIREFEALNQAIAKKRAASERLLIGYSIGRFFDQRILDVFEEYKSRNAEINPKIVRQAPNDIERKLLNEEIDMAFYVFPQGGEVHEGFSYIILEHLEYMLAVSKKHPKVNDDTKASDFDGEQAVYWNFTGSPDYVCRKNFNAYWKDIGITLFPTYMCTTLSSAYSEMLFTNAVFLCYAKDEICSFPDIVTYPLGKKKNFVCAWNNSASSDIKEIAELFRKFEIEPL